MDAAETVLGANGEPKGTTTLGELEKAGAQSAATVTGCDPENLRKQLRDYHRSKGLSKNTKLRADPFGKISDLKMEKMGTSSQNNGPTGRD